MSKHNEHTLVPKLRFPEFVGSVEWEEKMLINLAVNGFSNGVFNDPKKVGSGYRLINVIDMYSDFPIDEKKLTFLELTKLEFEKNQVEWGDVFFTRSSLVAEGIAKSNIYLGISNDVTFDGHLIRMRPQKEFINPIFLHYLLKTSYVRNNMIAKGKTGTMTTIGQSDLASIKVFIPNILPEQQKIAACLSSLDALISAESQKLELLKTHKKGLLQNLFPQAGENVPRLRFEEFVGSGDWEEVTIDSIGKVVTGGTPSKEEKEYWGGDFVWVTAQDFKDKFITDSVLKLSPKGRDKSRIIPPNSVLVTCIASIGLNGINKVECSTNQQINSIICNEMIHYEFISMVREELSIVKRQFCQGYRVV